MSEMASYKGPIAPETPPLSMPTSLDATESSNIAKEAAVALDLNRTKSLKRTHATALGSPGTAIDPYLNPIASPPKTARLDLAGRPGGSPIQEALTLMDDRPAKEHELRQMPPGVNDTTGYRVLTELNADNMATASTAVSRAEEAAMSVNTSQPMEVETTSPQSATSGVSMGGVPVTESPTPMDINVRIDPTVGQSGSSLPDDKSAASLSYPGPLQNMGSLPPTPTRGMTYPESNTPSSANKKYKCPYCDNEFTRHHNLKSHLLTHSQEKPYHCDVCPMKFRRLHDLKRHGKLHTGEKPHICPKCDRKFARGDALVRHTKGVMGCSTNRNSAGGGDGANDGGDDTEGPSMVDGDESAMTGVVFSTEDMSEEDRRRLSLASAKAEPSPSADANAAAAHARTYPPTRAPNVAAIFQPNNTVAKQASAPGTIAASIASAGNAALFAQSPGMTESPKPITPSPRVQTGQYTRRQSDRSAPSPHTTQATKLPGMSVFASGDIRFPQSPAGQQQQAATATGSTANGSHNIDNANNMFSGQAIWSQMQAMQDQMQKMTEKLSSMDQTHQMQLMQDQMQQMAEKMANMEQTHSLQISLLNSDITSLKKQLATKDAGVQT